jgi:phage host-nuclease inhibitor protein Gam
MAKLKSDQEIETHAQLEDAVLEMGRIDSAIKIIEAECDFEISEVRKRHADRLIIKKGKQPVTQADRRAELALKVESFCWANRDELLTGDVKYKQLKHGRVGWRKGVDKLDDSVAKTEGSRAFIVLADLVVTALAKFGLLVDTFLGFPIATYVEVKLSWNKKAIQKAIVDKTIDPIDAADAGFVIVEGMDEFYCEPKTE